MPAAKIRAQHRGASFVRADLHIHSFGDNGSFDVTDAGMTPEAIIDTALAKGLRVVSITDHNSIGNVSRGIAAAKGKEILFVPGVELATPGGHLLVFAPSIEALEKIYSRLTFDEKRTACRTSTFDVLKAASESDGIAVLAHIDQDAGIEAAIQGYGDPKACVLTSPSVVAVEIAKASAQTWYTEADPEEGRRNLLRRRIVALADPFITTLPKIQSSDAHCLSDLGKNVEREERLTRLKMSRLDWPSFRRAFDDPDARVRIEREIPQSVPRFLGMHVSGGFLADQTISLSPNLTCIIGGRGSGKSMAFHALRAVCGRPPPEDLSLSEVWPEQIDAIFKDEFGTDTHVRVGPDGQLANMSSPDEFAPAIAIESLAQGDMARTIERCGKDPSSLLDFLDELAATGDEKRLANDARQQLTENGNEIQRLRTEVARLPDVQKLLRAKEATEKAAREEKGHEIIEQQSALTKAIQVRGQILPAFAATVKRVTESLDESLLLDLDEVAELAQAVPELREENPIPSLVTTLRTALAQARSNLEQACQQSEAPLKAYVARCTSVQQNMHGELEKKAAALRARGIPLDLKAIAALSTDLQKFRAQEAGLKRKAKELEVAEKSREQLLQNLRDAEAAVERSRGVLQHRLNSQLGETLLDMNVKLVFREARFAPLVDAAIKEAMGWRTAAVPKAQSLVRALGVKELRRIIDKREVASLAKAQNEDGKSILEGAEAKALIEQMSLFENRRKLDELPCDDLPTLTVSRRAATVQGQPHTDGSQKPVLIVRDFAKLSLGQQQAIILGMLLCSDSRVPLLIDQPEDNLDSSFIFQVVVKALRRVKERRQVIVITHNANIGVLSDSDMIVPLKATAERGVVLEPGSVEAPSTQKLVCEILEGGRAAYERRGRLYGSLVRTAGT